MKYRLAPSILSANFAHLGDSVKAVCKAGADIIHFDVMDQHYVPNLTVGPLVCEALRADGITDPIDVHLMVQPVDDLIVAFAKAGASSISFHPEASLHVHRSLSLIRDLGCEAGLALNPGTGIPVLEPLWEAIDFVLIMSVNPGFAGQSFIPSTLDKIRALRQRADALNRSLSIAVDGGIVPENVRAIADAGADTFVAGTAIFKAANMALAIESFRRALI